MSIFLRIWLAFAVVLLAGSYFTIHALQDEIRPSVRQAIEDTLADNANLIAALVVDDLKSGRLQTQAFDQKIQSMLARPLQARIWDVEKTAVTQQLYITDAAGKVIYDSRGRDAGKDYSHWNDVSRTLAGKYGARTTRVVRDDESTSTMYVAAPVIDQGRIIGVVTLGKPSAMVQPFIDKAQRKMLWQGAWVVALSLFVSGLVAWWLRHAIHQVANYALSLSVTKREPLHFFAARELNQLVAAIDEMRQELEGKAYVETYVHTLTHELKSPLTAIQASAELLQEDLPEADRIRFARNVRQQADKLKRLAERLLLLARLEKRQEPLTFNRIALKPMLEQLLSDQQARVRQKQGVIRMNVPDEASVMADAFWLEQAIANVIDNALDFLEPEGVLALDWQAGDRESRLLICNDGPLIPDYALSQVFDRFYSLPGPDSGRKGTGIGLTLVAEVMSLHGGKASVSNRQDAAGVQVILAFSGINNH